MITAEKSKLLEGKRGLIVGIANDQSIAWGCGRAFRSLGAELAVTYLNEKAKKYVEPLAHALDASILNASRRACARPDGSGVRADRKGVGQARFCACIRSRSRPRRRCKGVW